MRGAATPAGMGTSSNAASALRVEGSLHAARAATSVSRKTAGLA